MKISTQTSQFLPTVGLRLKLSRNAVGMSQQSLADLIGITRGALANWERGTRLADPGAMVRYHNECNIDLNWIYMGDMSQLPLKIAERILENVPFQPNLVSQNRYDLLDKIQKMAEFQLAASQDTSPHDEG